MKILTDAKEIEDALKGKTVTSIYHGDDTIEIYYKGGVLSICIIAAQFVGLSDTLYVEVREDEKVRS